MQSWICLTILNLSQAIVTCFFLYSRVSLQGLSQALNLSVPTPVLCLNTAAGSLEGLTPTVSCINDYLCVLHISCIPVNYWQSKSDLGVQNLIDCSSARTLLCFSTIHTISSTKGVHHPYMKLVDTGAWILPLTCHCCCLPIK